MIKKMKILILLVLFLGINLIASTIQLKEGWNAIGINSEMSLDSIKQQLGDKLLMIQNPQGTKTYNYNLPSTVTQSFDQFEIGVGYWIKVSSDVDLTYTEESLAGQINMNLNAGWNLISPVSELDLDNIKQQLGNKLLMVQNPQGTKTYNYNLPSTVAQSFDRFESGVGYWIKVSENATLTFDVNNILPNQALDGTLHDSSMQIEYNGSQYTVKVLTDQVPPTSTTSNIIIYFNINGDAKQLGVSQVYGVKSKFQIAIYNSNNELVESGSIKEYIGDDYIQMGDIDFSDGSSGGYDIENPPSVPTGDVETPPNP